MWVDEISALLEVDFKSWVLTLFLILFAIAGIITLISQIVKFFRKPLHWFKVNDDDHKLIADTTDRFNKFQADMKKYGSYYAEMKKDMDEGTALSAKYYAELSDKINDFMDGMKESIAELKSNNKREDAQIDALSMGMIELLGSEFDRKFSKFVSLEGVPENERSAFTAIYEAYKRLGGNHKREEKYEYVMDHMKVMPVKTSFVTKEGEKDA